VKAVVIGGSRLESVEIDPEVIDPDDVELLQDLVTAAVNDALETASQSAQEKMSAITGGLNIPGLM
jgi:DNA-binding protein YbaB